MSAQCKSCGAAIIWVKSYVSDKPMPLDAVPVAKGNVVVNDGFGIVYGAPAHEHDKPDFKPFAHLSHFVTCPHAKQHRRLNAGVERRTKERRGPAVEQFRLPIVK